RRDQRKPIIRRVLACQPAHLITGDLHAARPVARRRNGMACQAVGGFRDREQRFLVRMLEARATPVARHSRERVTPVTFMAGGAPLQWRVLPSIAHDASLE